MNRRIFLKNVVISVPLTSVMTYISLKKFFYSVNEVVLDTNQKIVNVQNNKTIILPSHPSDHHCIEFFLDQGLIDDQSSRYPKIISKSHTIVREQSPLVIDSPGRFRLAFEAKSQDWYVVTC